MSVQYDVLFRDDFTGTDHHPPHRGKWFKYIARHGAVVLGAKICEIETNALHLKLVETGVAAYASISAVTRAEFKPPFKFRYTTTIVDQRFRGSLSTSDIRDGYMPDSHIYGKELVNWGAYDGNDFWLTCTKDGAPVTTTSGAVHANDAEPYRVEATVTDLGTYYHIDITFILVATGATLWSSDGDFDRPACKHLRIRHYCYVTNGTGEMTVDDMVVWGVKSRKPAARVTIDNVTSTDVITEDILDFRIQNRVDSYPSASVTVKNPGNKYSAISAKAEIEVCAGFEGMLWLLFRGYVEAPRRTFPPALLHIESSKGYGKRLDFEETDNESFTAHKPGAIVVDIVGTYFSTVFTTDHVDATGGSTIDAESDDQPCGQFMESLKDADKYILYVDLNRDIHFCDPTTESSTSNITIEQGEDVESIENTIIDEIVNHLTVKGGGPSIPVHVYDDPGSQAAYWKRSKTIRDDGLTSTAAVTAKAHAIGPTMIAPLREVPLSLPEIYPLQIYDTLIVDCDEVGLSAFSAMVYDVSYDYGMGGLRTAIMTSGRGFVLSDVLLSHQQHVEERSVQGVVDSNYDWLSLPTSYIIGHDASDYWAINGRTKTLEFGGPYDTGGIDGADCDDVVQAALAAGGTHIFLRSGITWIPHDNTIPSGVTIEGEDIATCIIETVDPDADTLVLAAKSMIANVTVTDATAPTGSGKAAGDPMRVHFCLNSRDTTSVNFSAYPDQAWVVDTGEPGVDRPGVAVNNYGTGDAYWAGVVGNGLGFNIHVNNGNAAGTGRGGVIKVWGAGYGQQIEAGPSSGACTLLHLFTDAKSSNSVVPLRIVPLNPIASCIEITTEALTAGTMLNLYQKTSAFTGKGLLMHFADGAGSFTGKFISLLKNSVELFGIDANGYLIPITVVGPATGDDITVTSGTKTGGSMINLYQGASAWASGYGLYMNFGAGGGSFSKDFIWCDINAVPKFRVHNSGWVKGNVGGLSTLVAAHAITDADFAVDESGNIAIDDANHRWYMRDATGWHYCAQDAGFQIPVEETNCPACHQPMIPGQEVKQVLDSYMSDKALHGHYEHRTCPN